MRSPRTWTRSKNASSAGRSGSAIGFGPATVSQRWHPRSPSLSQQSYEQAARSNPNWPTTSMLTRASWPSAPLSATGANITPRKLDCLTNNARARFANDAINFCRSETDLSRPIRDHDGPLFHVGIYDGVQRHPHSSLQGCVHARLLPRDARPVRVLRRLLHRLAPLLRNFGKPRRSDRAARI